MKIAFDEEVNVDDIETLRKLMNKVRNPMSVTDTFAFQGQMHVQPHPGKTHKEKNASLRYSSIILLFKGFLVCRE